MRERIGQYRVESVLGQGGMGVVYRGVHVTLGRPVAIKALAPELTRQPEFRDRFFSEAKTQAQLQHPNVVAVYDLLEEDGDYFIVMELATGHPLDERMEQAAGRGMDRDESLTVFRQILEALDYAHSKGVIHRDIKPSNVLLEPGGGIKLMDFGIALLVGDKRLTASQSAIGTPIYMSPEQILRPREVDHRTDIYSAAVVLFEMLAGRPPFDGETEYGIKKLHVESSPPDLGELRSGLPAAWVGAIGTALSKDPNERFASAGAFLRALDGIVPSAPSIPPPAPRRMSPRTTTLDAGPPPPPPPSSPRPRRLPGLLAADRPRWVVPVALAVLVLLVVGSGALLSTVLAPDDEAVEASAGEPISASTAGLSPMSLDVTPIRPLSRTDGPSGPTLDLSAVEVPTVEREESVPPEATPRPAPRRERKRNTASKPSPPVPKPDPVERAPLPPPEPKPERAVASPAPAPGADDSTLLEDLTRFDGLVERIEKRSEDLYDAYENQDREDPLLDALDRLSESAETMRKKFRKASGTGWRGAMSKARGRDGDYSDFYALVRGLTRQIFTVDNLMQTYEAPRNVRALWTTVRGDILELSGQLDP